MSNVNTSAVIVLNETGQILLLRRGKTAPWEPGKWSLPGGVIDPGETPEQAAIRETYEEVGIRINQIKKLKVIDSGEGWAIAFFICKDWSGTPELKETHGVLENDQMAWADKNELKRYRFVPTVSEALTTYFEGIKMKFNENYIKKVIKEEIQIVLETEFDRGEQEFLNSGDPRGYHNNLKTIMLMRNPRPSEEELFVLFGNQLIEMYDQEATTGEGVPIHHLKFDLGREGIHNMEELIQDFDVNPHKNKAVFDIRTDANGKYILVANDKFESKPLTEKKKACKPAKGKRFAKRVNGKCRSFGQAGQAKGGGDRIRPGTKKGDAYCARSAKIKKCKNPPCANDLSRKKWKCRGSKSMK